MMAQHLRGATVASGRRRFAVVLIVSGMLFGASAARGAGADPQSVAYRLAGCPDVFQGVRETFINVVPFRSMEATVQIGAGQPLNDPFMIRIGPGPCSDLAAQDDSTVQVSSAHQVSFIIPVGAEYIVVPSGAVVRFSRAP